MVAKNKRKRTPEADDLGVTEIKKDLRELFQHVLPKRVDKAFLHRLGFMNEESFWYALAHEPIMDVLYKQKMKSRRVQKQIRDQLKIKTVSKKYAQEQGFDSIEEFYYDALMKEAENELDASSIRAGREGSFCPMMGRERDEMKQKTQEHRSSLPRAHRAVDSTGKLTHLHYK